MWKNVIVLLFFIVAFTPSSNSQTLEFAYDVNGNNLSKKYISAIPARPVVTQNATLLSSSAATGNQWFLANDSIIGATSQTYNPPVNGVYKVRVRNIYGCVSDFSVPVTYSVTSVINLPNDQFVKVGPNPTEGPFNINFRLTNSRVVEYWIYDINGKVMKHILTLSSGEQADISNLSPGIYLLRIKTKDNKTDVTARIIKL